MRRRALVVMVVVAACSDAKKPAPPPLPQQNRAEIPLPIRIGTCAHAGYRFVSGPYPRDVLVTDPPPPAPSPLPPFASMKVNKPLPSFALPPLDPARTAGYVGPDTLHDTGSSAPTTGDLLGSGSAETMGLGMRGTGPQNTGPTYGGGIGSGPLGGFGYGSGYRRDAKSPITLGEPTVKPREVLDVAIVRRYIKRNIQKLSLCYERMQNENEKLAGTVTASFVIGADGFVATSSATGVDPEVASCIARTIKEIQFPKPKNGTPDKPAIANVEYSFTFKPAGDAELHLAEYQAMYYRTSERARTGLFDTDPRNRTSAAGASNPLANEVATIETCLRAGPTRAGALVFELAFDASGALTTSTIHGIDDAAVKTCLGKALASTHGAEGVQRCSLAFGELPLDQMPALEITATGVALAGKSLSDLPTIEASPKPTSAIAAAITARVAATVASRSVVTLHGPLVVKPDPTISMRIVKRVLSSITAGGDDFVLATKRPDGWKLPKPPPDPKIIHPLVLPVVPMPVGTGAVWNPLRVSGSNGYPVIAAWVRVEKDRVEVRSDEPTQTVAIGDVGIKLEDTLKKLNRDVILSAADDVPYEVFMGVVDVVQHAGFAQWQLAAE